MEDTSTKVISLADLLPKPKEKYDASEYMMLGTNQKKKLVDLAMAKVPKDLYDESKTTMVTLALYIFATMEDKDIRKRLKEGK